MSFDRRFDCPVPLAVHHAGNSEQLLRLIEQAGRRTALSDLSLGPSQGFQVVHELCVQLGITVPAPAMIRTDAATSPEDLLTLWIDGEGRGDFAASAAYDLAVRIVDILRDAPPAALFVLTPWPGHAWGEDNAQSLKFLALGLRGTPHSLALIQTRMGEPPPLPEPIRLEARSNEVIAAPLPRHAAGPLAALPGLVPAAFIERLPIDLLREGLLPLEGELLLVAPEDRVPPAALSDGALAALAAASAEPPPGSDWRWCHAFALAHRAVDAAAAAEIRVAAWSLAGVGGFDAAQGLLEQAAHRATPLLATELIKDRLHMVIAAMRFDLAAAVEDPDERLPPLAQQEIRYCKGWGSVMNGDAAEALRQFEAAGPPDPSAATTGSAQDLYLLNIYALVRFRNGDRDGAMVLEQAVEAATQAAAQGPGRALWHLRYINSVNLSRLYRNAGDVEMAERYFRKGFSLLDELRGESDQVYGNIMLARFAVARGDPEEARRATLRTCLHWLAMTVPDAIGWRTARSLLAPTLAARIMPGKALPLHMVAEISRALHADLVAAQERVRRAVPTATDDGPWFAAAAPFVPYLPDRPVCICAAPGWAAVDYASSLPPPQTCCDEATLQLRGTVHAVLAQDLGGEGFSSGAVLIDPRSGRDVPQTEAEVLESAWRWRASRIRLGQRDLALAEGQLDDALDGANVGPSKAIASVHRDTAGSTVTFHRQRPAARVAALPAAALDLVQVAGTIRELMPALRGHMSREDAIYALRVLDASGLLIWDFTAPARDLRLTF